MKRERSTPERPKDGDYAWSDYGTRVGFTSAGSFVTEPVAIHQNTTNFVLGMVRRRRGGTPTPANVAMEVGVHNVHDAFPNSAEWSGLDRVDHWPIVSCGTSAEEMVKRCVRPSVGRPLSPRDMKVVSNVAFEVAEAVCALFDRRGLDRGRNPVRIRLLFIAGEVTRRGGTIEDATKLVERQLVELYGEWVDESADAEESVPLE